VRWHSKSHVPSSWTRTSDGNSPRHSRPSNTVAYVVTNQWGRVRLTVAGERNVRPVLCISPVAAHPMGQWSYAAPAPFIGTLHPHRWRGCRVVDRQLRRQRRDPRKISAGRRSAQSSVRVTLADVARSALRLALGIDGADLGARTWAARTCARVTCARVPGRARPGRRGPGAGAYLRGAYLRGAYCAARTCAARTVRRSTYRLGS